MVYLVLGDLGFALRFGSRFAGLQRFLTHRPQSSSFLGLPYRILNMNPKTELLWGLWVGFMELIDFAGFGGCV